MDESKKERQKMKAIILWFWSLIKKLFRRKPKRDYDIDAMRYFAHIKQEDKTTKQKRKLTRLSRKLNRGKNKSKTQRRYK